MMETFSNLIFDPNTHSYSMDGLSLTPVTQFVSTLKEDTNWAEVAQKVADKRGQSASLILKEWEEKRDKAAQKGTLVHDYIETRLKGKPYSSNENWVEEMSAWERFWHEHKKYLTSFHVELKVGDKELGLGGTIDWLAFDSRTQKYHIYDWKTGGKFTIENPWQSLQHPFNDLPDCHYSNYTLQLCCYRLILNRHTDLELGECRIIRLRDDGEYRLYPCFDMTKRIQNYLLTEF